MNLAPGVAGLGDLVEIGRGGFGVVYRAVEHDLGRPVAVKILSGTLDGSSRRRFARECRAMGKVAGHPHVVAIHRAGRTDADQPFIVMELMQRGSLQDRLRRDGAVGWVEAIRIGMDIASALDMAHSVGVCHRDVKPGNLLVSSHGVVKLADFGMALIAGSDETRSGVVAASLAHVAPEVLAGTRPDARADVYSLGSTLYELMRGSAPFTRKGEDSLVPMLVRIAMDPPPSLTDVGVPAAVSAVVARAMAKDPADRPASAGELRQELERARAAPRASAAAAHRAPKPDVAPEPSPESGKLAPPARSRFVTMLGAVAVSLVLVAATVARLVTGEPLLPAPGTGDAAMSRVDPDRALDIVAETEPVSGDPGGNWVQR